MKLKLDFKMLFPKEPAFNLARHKWRQNVQLVVVQNYLKRTGREEWAKQVTKCDSWAFFAEDERYH